MLGTPLSTNDTTSNKQIKEEQMYIFKENNYGYA